MKNRIHISEKHRWLVIADDLTGALDAVAPFAMRGAKCEVMIEPHKFDINQTSADVVGLSTDSREMSSKSAASIVKNIGEQILEGWTVIKKIDSRLKGNISTELNALKKKKFLFLPAIPEMGRFVSDGMVIGHGILNPIKIADVLSNLQGVFYAPDVATIDQMQNVVCSWNGIDTLVGARGLTSALAQIQYGDRREYIKLFGPILAAIGSQDRITVEQISACEHLALGHQLWPSNEWVRPLKESNILQVEMGDQSLSLLPEFAQHVVNNVQGIKSLFLSGGATAKAVLNALNIYKLDVVGESDLGLPISQAKGLSFITKSGGFGESNTLEKIMCQGLAQDEKS